MINLAVINLKDLIKVIRNIILIIIIVLIFLKIIFALRNANYVDIDKLKNNYFHSYINSNLLDRNLLISNCFKTEKTISKKESGIKRVLVSELSIFSVEEKLMEIENQEEVLEFTNEDGNEKKENINNNENDINDESTQNDSEKLLPTKVIIENNKNDTYTDIYKSVKIKNESSYNLTEDMVTPNIDFQNKKDIIIYHTHTCESYTPTEKNNYIASGNFRTTDLSHSVAEVGNILAENLRAFEFNVNHNTTYHDYPAYTGSYTRGLSTITSILKDNPNTQFVIDLHRDALGSNSKYGPTVQIGDEIVSQIMFVIGTDGGGLEHPNWINNLKLAIKIQEKANEMYPGLFKPIILRNSRYNQHVTTGAMIIEVGATGNTLEECNMSMKYLANVINEVLK